MGQLVGARRVLVAAPDAAQLGHSVGSLHAPQQYRQALQVAMASASKEDIAYHTVIIEFKVDLGRACPLSIVSVSHIGLDAIIIGFGLG